MGITNHVRFRLVPYLDSPRVATDPLSRPEVSLAGHRSFPAQRASAASDSSTLIVSNPPEMVVGMPERFQPCMRFCHWHRTGMAIRAAPREQNPWLRKPNDAKSNLSTWIPYLHSGFLLGTKCIKYVIIPSTHPDGVRISYCEINKVPRYAPTLKTYA